MTACNDPNRAISEADAVKRVTLTFTNEPCHRTPQNPTRQLLCECGEPIHDQIAASHRGVVVDVSEPDAVEERQVHADDQGMFLFLLGLLAGLVEQRSTNVRMGPAAHLEGIMNGILLILGAASSDVKLTPRWKTTA